MHKLFPLIPAINYVVSGRSKPMANEAVDIHSNVEFRAQLCLQAHPLVIWMGKIWVEQVNV